MGILAYLNNVTEKQSNILTCLLETGARETARNNSSLTAATKGLTAKNKELNDCEC